ncbi:EAL domain-containing protein [Butyrivibrio sp. DSM 10294]|uniref:EAL domain-containing protein n=1 Tax=Butyrivibrio sp. DSM 10294 TaxID=2972457 RepID=UPI00234E61FB|nr:EAL domain-containing protein [Butyrivibrio sp. DSM 10294]MDC7293259.1 EAL domain-containing protein [Butyrivibrio sp. DSM 10294]
MRSIRSTITLITVLVILVSIVSVSGASHVIIWNETINNSVETMNLINTGTERLLENYFESVKESVDIVSNIAIDDLDSVLLVEEGAVGQKAARTPTQIKELDDYIVRYCNGIQPLFSSVADNTEGVISYYYCIDPGLSKSEHGFFYMKKGKTGLIRQNPLDASALEVNEGLEASWYDTAVAKGSPGWIGPYIYQGEWVCSYMVPIYKAGVLIGVMGVDISCEALAAQVKDFRLYKTGFVCLLDKTGRIIYHPEATMGSSFDWLPKEVQLQIMQTNNSNDDLIRYTKNGQKRQLSFSTLSNGMKLCCIVPVEEINASWRALLWGTSLITIIIIIIFVMLIFFVMGAITKPLQQLTDASKKLADSNYNVDLTYQSKNEIGALTEAFRKMRDRIRHNIEDLNHQIYYDRLTDLPNMRKFFSLAAQERDRLKAEGKEAVMVYINMIGIRNYNRRYGFKKGDMLMIDFARILSKNFGENRVCRFSGDRFTAVADAAEVEGILSDILKECETIMSGSRLPIRVGIYPDKLEDVDTDVACDRAKYACDRKKGGLASTITYYDEDMLKRSEIDQHIINSLDRALKEGWVKVYYQPIVRASTGKVCDEEALARWVDPELGFLSPEYFIHALEQSKLIYKLDLYVLEEVLKKLKRQEADGFYPVPQSVNLSRMDFESCDLVEEIRRRVDDAGIRRSMISIEITESVIGGNFEFMKQQIDRFRSLGFPVWMDDFGSGYSSLDVLHQIHFDLFKFDMRFMERFNEGDASRIILTQMVNMAKGLGIDTLCEGVEEKEQAEFLKEIGCTRIQGFYYGKARSYEEIVDIFEKGSSLHFESPEEASR